MKAIKACELDWNLLWQQEKSEKTWKSKSAEDWNRKAASFARRTATSIYIQRFLDLLQPQKDLSILDAGCGPGTLALPLAARIRKVSALDFSEKMLELLEEQARERNLDNIFIHHCSWEDSWEHIPPHDIAVASRSLAVHDLKKALLKLTGKARHKVVVTDRVKHGPFDPDAFTALGRPLKTGPDYIYTVNLLYQLGFLPTVDYIHLEERLSYESMDDALDGYRWMFRDLSEDEEKRLQKYVESITTLADDGTVTVHRATVPVWAYITWTP